MRRYNWNKIRLQCGWTLCPTVYLTLFFVRKYPAWWFNAESENGVLFLKFIHGYCAVMCHKEQRGHPANKRKGSHSRHKPLPSLFPLQECTALHLAVSCQALKIVAPATEVWIYFSVRATLTTTKSPAIPDTLLGCQSRRSCQNSYRTTGFCEAEDKAEPLNKNPIHNPTAFIHLAFPLSPSPSRPVQAGSNSSNHLQSPFPGPRQTMLTISLLTQKQLAEFGGVERGRADRVETAPTPDTALYPFYCSGNTFLTLSCRSKDYDTQPSAGRTLMCQWPCKADNHHCAGERWAATLPLQPINPAQTSVSPTQLTPHTWWNAVRKDVSYRS